MLVCQQSPNSTASWRLALERRVACVSLSGEEDWTEARRHVIKRRRWQHLTGLAAGSPLSTSSHHSRLGLPLQQQTASAAADYFPLKTRCALVRQSPPCVFRCDRHSKWARAHFNGHCHSIRGENVKHQLQSNQVPSTFLLVVWPLKSLQELEKNKESSSYYGKQCKNFTSREIGTLVVDKSKAKASPLVLQ